MRYKDFIQVLNGLFDLMNNHGLALAISEAMQHANDTGSGVFYDEGTEYVITQKWHDSCYKGDCNPATCYTKWSLT